MLKNYIKIAMRNLRRHKGYALINVAGLTVGMACCALILLYIRNELGYDRFHQKAGRIYRLTNTILREGESRTISAMAAPIGPALVEEYPEIVNSVRLLPPYHQTLVTYESKQFYENGLYYADPSLFTVFDFPLQSGDPQAALRNKKSVVLSPETAKKYFGEENPPGKILKIERGEGDFQVTGILKTIPHTSHLRPDFIIPFSNLYERQLSNWWMFSYPTYVLLSEQASAAALANKLPEFIKKHYSDSPPGFPGMRLGLQPLVDVHLRSDFGNQAGELSAMTYLYLFAALAFFIIAVACVNFMNLATARSQHRAREVGVRKVIGGRRTQLILQFISESVILAFIATLGAVMLIEFFLPIFNELARKNLQIDYGADWLFIAGFLLLALIVGIASGSYPAFFLSRFQPVEVFKGGLRPGVSGARLRQLLVVGQFAISIALIASTLVVNDQIEYIRNKRLGFDKEQVVVVPLRSEQAQNNWPSLKTELLRHPEILAATAASGVPADRNRRITQSKRVEVGGEKDIHTYQIDYNFFATLGIELAAGRFLSREFPSDSAQAFVLNEAAVKEFGWESATAALGQTFIWLGHGPENPKNGTVVGVVKDFHFRPLYEEIAPAVFHLMPERLHYLVTRVRPHAMEQALAILRDEWRSFDPGHPLEFSFMDEKVNAQYGAETRLLKIFGIFSTFAVFISCLGLFGLVSFTTEQRTKEIGIRKVLGASVASITFMLSNGFARLVLIAFVVATPLAWWAMNKWLQNFAYRAEAGWPIFALAGGMALLIALLTVSTQAIKAALANPVDALRYE
jgi:putative ABC transport system permease protein